MSKLGATLFVFGAMSCLLKLVGYDLILVMWVDLWGATIGWVIRGALIVGGLALWAYEAIQEEDAPESPAEG
jgi:hypothetical protein